ncbi:hypothetical protein HF086_008851 [Spodoptera exigua]|uniref:Uncharacterized protein n=1 Tax=Spodoptera exigua TaxID=7107 RepID=A0A922MV80_SPOEX|nr:hypothetical protein HF086_008851 [Spodoptera exigua]
MQSGVEEDAGAGGAAAGLAWGQPHTRQPHSKLFPRKHRSSPPTQPAAPGPVPAQQMWVGWANTSGGFVPQAINSQPFPAPHYQQPPPQAPAQQQSSQQPSQNPFQLLKTAFPGLSDVSNIRLSSLSVERVCAVTRAALGAAGEQCAARLARHNVCGLVLAVCRLHDLQPVPEYPCYNNLPIMSEKSAEAEIDAAKPPRHTLETQRSRPSNVEKQVTLEEQMICGALQTLNEEALEDVLQSEPPSHPGEPLRTIREYPPPSPSPGDSALPLPPAPADEPETRRDHVVVNFTDDVFL